MHKEIKYSSLSKATIFLKPNIFHCIEKQLFKKYSQWYKERLKTSNIHTSQCKKKNIYIKNEYVTCMRKTIFPKTKYASLK